jgi:hypothetical protein
MLFPIRSRSALAALLSSGLLLAAGTGATAQQAGKPAPGCGGIAAEDPAGDVASGGDNYDVKAMYFTFDGVRANVHLQIADLDKAISKPGASARWIVIYRVGDAFYYVRMLGNGTDVDYRYGTYDPTLDDYTGVADVKGALVEGKDGVITMEIAKASGVKPGAKIVESYVKVTETAETGEPANQVVYAPESDRAPDSGSAKEYTFATCPGSGGGGGGGGGTTPSPAPAPAPTSPPPSSEPAQLGIKASAKAGSARKASKRKRVTLKLTSSQRVTGLKAELLKGNRVLGTASMAQIEGRAKVTVKVKGRLAKGTYGLRLTGTVPDGRTAQSIVKVKLAR